MYHVKKIGECGVVYGTYVRIYERDPLFLESANIQRTAMHAKGTATGLASVRKLVHAGYRFWNSSRCLLAVLDE